MTLAELNTILKTANGFKDKVVYRAWPVGHAPNLPFICYLMDSSDNFGADNKVYKTINRVRVELYTEYKDETSESAIESVFDSNDIYWEKDETYVDDEDCYLIIYTIEV